MQTSEFEQFSDMWTAAYELTGNCKQPTPRALDLAFELLADFDLQQVSQALSLHCKDPKSGQFQPKPADIVRLIQGTPDDAAMAAWAKVDSATRRVGTGPSWVFDDPKIHRALHEMGGLGHLGSATEKDWPFIRAEFCKRYASPVNQGPYPGRLQGWHKDGELVKIGDCDRCQKVLSGGAEVGLQLTSAAHVAAGLIEQMKAD